MGGEGRTENREHGRNELRSSRAGAGCVPTWQHAGRRLERVVPAAGVATLDLGRVETVATVFVNGRKVRTLWAPPYRCQVELAAGANELRVEVANTWFNRLVYDAGQPEAQRKTWTIGAPKKDAPPWNRRASSAPSRSRSDATGL